MSEIIIERVTNGAERRLFIEFPWKVYKNEPNWVPPLLSVRRELLDPDKNPSFEYLTADLFIGWREAKPVGVIAAFENPRHNEVHDDNIGFFGFFEVMNDPEAARALLGAAEEWARARGLDAVRGPVSFTLDDEIGVLVDGFDILPSILTPYTPRYYPNLIEGAGYGKVKDVVCWFMDAGMVEQDTPAMRKVRRLIPLLEKRYGIVARHADMDNLDREIDYLKGMYSGAWAENWGFVPPTDAEMQTLIENMIQFFDPELTWIAEVEGEPIGFMMCIPDINQAIHAAYPRPGTPEIWTMLKLAWYWKVKGVIDRVRIPLMGVLPEWQGKGVDAFLYYYAAKAVVEKGFYKADFGWVLEDNLQMNQVGDLWGAEPYRTYRIYQKALAH
jgi:GNAT superfamily N-acetyltransferase